MGDTKEAKEVAATVLADEAKRSIPVVEAEKEVSAQRRWNLEFANLIGCMHFDRKSNNSLRNTFSIGMAVRMAVSSTSAKSRRLIHRG